MTPRERAERIARQLDDDLNLAGARDRLYIAEIVEREIVEATRTITDNPARVAELETALASETERCESLLAALKDRTTERDEAIHISNTWQSDYEAARADLAQRDAELDRAEAFAEMIVGMLINVGHDYASDKHLANCWECRDLAKDVAALYADARNSRGGTE